MTLELKTMIPFEVWQITADLANLIELLLIGNENPARLGFFQLKVNLSSSQRRMRRDVDRAGGEYGHVGDKPFHPVLRKQPNPVAYLDTSVDQGRGARQNLRSVMFPAQIVIESMLLVAERGFRSQ
jgi:hypothetical protein